MSGDSPLERNGPGWTTGPRSRLPTNADYGRMVLETLRSEAAVNPPQGGDR